ncbi:hypothetical protein HN858_02205 [Candidatus Falkowbacteria bacterium]|jgi:hypothetical protein|nr:hypothetical protein [Candidatus Falkowbacteria bacterium]MBT5502803.1 hypothetical protein [Candidatus Falkowbacteria bacterium]MBT6573426.1 hypothetical protein [Candidatus Falkowbacteria bacterium]MBT7348468.1 hypothetical protein [Candidatus Falkowbacteria bacterium]MBT7501188.1 hypothetical protein [Candidatus Falkowbacteria bacterium]
MSSGNCRSCGGSGKDWAIHLRHPSGGRYEDCSSCNGTGNCGRCNGTGEAGDENYGGCWYCSENKDKA